MYHPPGGADDAPPGFALSRGFPAVLRRLRISLVVTALLLAGRLAHAADAEVAVIRAEARADGTGFTAKTQAIARAQENAIGQLLGTLAPNVDPQLMEPIFREAGRYVDSYDLLRHDNLGDNTKVEIDVHIATRPLQQDLAAIVLPRLPEPPAVVLLVGEQLVGDKIIAVPDNGVGETALRAGLRKMGLKVASSSELAAAYNQADFIDTVNGGAEAGARFAQENLCEAAIVGTASCALEPNAFGTNVARVRATVTLRIYRGVDGKMMEETVAHAAIAGEDTLAASEEAIRDACTKIQGDATVATVMAVLAAVGKDRVHLMIPSPGPREHADAVYHALQGEDLVSGLSEPFYSPKMYRVSMDYEGPMAYLVAMLSPGKYPAKALVIDRVLNRIITAHFE